MSNGNGSGVLGELSTFPVLTTPMEIERGVEGSSVGGADETGARMTRLVSGMLRNVLGWNPSTSDPRGFEGALEQAFDLTEFEGRVESKWKPRTFAVFTDLEGGVTGAQASVYARAKDALEHALPLLDGLYSLTHKADPEDSSAIKSLIREHLSSLVGELGRLGGPRVARVDQLFDLLLGKGRDPSDTADEVEEGELHELGDELGLIKANKHVNTVEEEMNQTNYRILADYVVGLNAAWVANRKHFAGGGKAFFGTQLVHFSRQLAVIAESVGELRFALSSVMIGARERQTLNLVPGHFDEAHWPPDHVLTDHELSTLSLDDEESIYLEDLLTWIESFAREEGPRLIRDGGKHGVQAAFVPTAKRLGALLCGIRCPQDNAPAGFSSHRVRNSLRELEGQIAALVKVAEHVKHAPNPKRHKKGTPPSSPPLSGSEGRKPTAKV